jgi:hypothetical protein
MCVSSAISGEPLPTSLTAERGRGSPNLNGLVALEQRAVDVQSELTWQGKQVTLGVTVILSPVYHSSTQFLNNWGRLSHPGIGMWPGTRVSSVMVSKYVLC